MLLDPHVLGEEPDDVADEEPGPVAGEGVEDLLCVFEGAGYRFLQDDVPALARRPEGQVLVEGGRQADVHHLDVFGRDERLVGGVRPRPDCFGAGHGALVRASATPTTSTPGMLA